MTARQLNEISGAKRRFGNGNKLTECGFQERRLEQAKLNRRGFKST